MDLHGFQGKGPVESQCFLCGSLERLLCLARMDPSKPSMLLGMLWNEAREKT